MSHKTESIDDAMDFQAATAKRVLEVYKSGHRRVLIADEVGLGKTFVARKVVELVREWHKTELQDDFFKVVYICSNANIADQNIEKLKVGKKEDRINISECRLSMQHLKLAQAEKAIKRSSKEEGMPESIIPLTPSTSFRFFSTQGTAHERALMYCVLSRCYDWCSPKVGDYLSCGVGSWDDCTCYYFQKIKALGSKYLSRMKDALDDELTQEDIDSLKACREDERSGVINRFRHIFAKISIAMMDPDLVIMDEFQRFSSLLVKGKDEQSMLVDKFFNSDSGDPARSPKILLLSATPYKPYSTLEELNDGENGHFQDFMNVMEFLFVTPEKVMDFKESWNAYTRALNNVGGDIDALVKAKDAAENALYNVMCRTERFNSGIIDDSRVCEVPVLEGDILSYAHCQCLMERLAQAGACGSMGRFPMEYVKSAPYLLSFMDRYELKRKIESALKTVDAKACCKGLNTLMLRKSWISDYKHIDPSNGKLKYLHDMVFGADKKERASGAHLLLWVPASNPYYMAGGVFESESARSFSKIILFSSWEMVPRMISAMMSYYSELYTLGALQKGLRYFSRNRYGEKRMVLSNDKDEVREHVLEYPCHVLAECYDPKDFYGMDLSCIRSVVTRNIAAMIDEHQFLGRLPKRQGSADLILNIMKLLDGKHVDSNEISEIPYDAAEILTNIAIGSPAVCAYRISRNDDDAVMAAKAVASIFRKPEAVAVIDCLYRGDSADVYYKSVLDYCVKGNLQAVLDEYTHICGAPLGEAMKEAVIDTSTIGVDTYESLCADQQKKMNMRCHFAVPFIDKTVTDKSVKRTQNIRNAFNSPFRPFILSTTSVGQEGLDFHNYSRRIVHWNLPSNPVDLEQREGRINRFKCLAIRRNVARLFAGNTYSCWDELFAAAEARLKGTYSYMVPYWCLPMADLTEEERQKMEYIERIVPYYPLSRDRYKYERLVSVLALYRLTLGQPRQEELLNLIRSMNLSEEQVRELTINLSPFEKSRGIS